MSELTAMVASALSLREHLCRFDADLFSGEECAALAEELSRAEKACAGARLLAAARAVGCGAHGVRSSSDAASWVARQGGTTTGEARRALVTAQGLAALPDTRAAVVSGEVSLDQAGEITRAAHEVPGCEASLLEEARRGDLSVLRERAREVRLGHIDPRTLHLRQHRARRLRHWRDDLGMVRITAALEPADGVALVSRLEDAAHALRREARGRGGETERFDAYLADALCAIASRGEPGGEPPVGEPPVGEPPGGEPPGGEPPGGEPPGGDGPPPRPQRGWKADLVIVCDLSAYRRGHAHPGEPAHIVGGGPIPVSVVRELSHDAFIKAVLHDGVAVQTISHLGRHIPAALRSALDLGAPPEFLGARCVDCASAYGLEYDHVDPVANRGKTSYENLVARCWTDHHAKTERDRAAGRLGRREAARGNAPRTGPGQAGPTRAGPTRAGPTQAGPTQARRQRPPPSGA